jgi:hypothetical protein
VPKFTIMYQRNVVDTVEAKDIDHAARLACAAVLGLPKEYGAKVLSILRDDPPALPPPPNDPASTDKAA